MSTTQNSISHGLAAVHRQHSYKSRWTIGTFRPRTGILYHPLEVPLAQRSLGWPLSMRSGPPWLPQTYLDRKNEVVQSRVSSDPCPRAPRAINPLRSVTHSIETSAQHQTSHCDVAHSKMRHVQSRHPTKRIPWTKKEYKTLVKMKEDGYSWEEVSDALLSRTP